MKEITGKQKTKSKFFPQKLKFIKPLNKIHKTFKTLNIMLPKTSAYVKSYDGQTKWMYFLIKDADIFRKI